MNKKNKPNFTIVERYNPEINTGLSSEQVNERIADGQTNKAEKKYSKSLLSIFITNVCTLFNLLGLIVFIGLIYAKAELFNFVFAVVYLVNILIGIVQEIRAKFCTEKLSLLSARQNTVVRDGQKIEISSNDIVLDDIILLQLGNQVPTDCKILAGDIEVNESLLTGESVAVKKTVGDILFAGSYITGGNCTVQATRVGKHNYISKLAARAKKYKKPHSEIIGSLKLIIRFLSFIIIPFGIVYYVKGLLKGNPAPAIIIETSTVIIGMIPSGLMLLTSLALAVGIIKLAKHKTLVQDLYSLEMLARVDTICFDKTGTITDGRMTVKEILPLSDKINYDVHKIFSSMLGTLNDNNQTAIALFDKFGGEIHYRSTASLPFNSIRKLSAVSFEDLGTFAMGAPEFVLSKERYDEIKPFVNQYAGLGYRVLLLAHSKKDIKNDTVPNDLVPCYLILIVDNIREDAKSTVKWFQDNDVNIKVISGDNPITVSEVARRVGIKDADKYISLEGLTDSEIIAIADKYTVFGRVSPEQKAVLVKALKTAGHTTAMTGDGINDILALKEADCAITVASGSEAVKNISHIILLDNNFNSMPKVVYEGRRVINNVQNSAALYLMKTGFVILLSLFCLILPFIEYPFKLNQMNLLEIFVIAIPSFFLSLQPNDSRINGKFINQIMQKTLPSAFLMFLSVVIIEIFHQTVGKFDSDLYSTLSVYAVTFSGLISLYEISLPMNKYRLTLFLSTLAIVLGITVFALFNGLKILGLVAITFKEHWALILLVVSVLMLNSILWSFVQRLFSKIKFNEIKLDKNK